MKNKGTMYKNRSLNFFFLVFSSDLQNNNLETLHVIRKIKYSKQHFEKKMGVLLKQGKLYSDNLLEIKI